MMPWEDFAERCRVLHHRGLRDRILADLGAAGDFDVLAQVEALDADGIAALNAAAAPK